MRWVGKGCVFFKLDGVGVSGNSRVYSFMVGSRRGYIYTTVHARGAISLHRHGAWTLEHVCWLSLCWIREWTIFFGGGKECDIFFFWTCEWYQMRILLSKELRAPKMGYFKDFVSVEKCFFVSFLFILKLHFVFFFLFLICFFYLVFILQLYFVFVFNS